VLAVAVAVVITLLVELLALEAVDKAGMVLEPVVDRLAQPTLVLVEAVEQVVQPLLVQVVQAL
jgi:hypothetical protein